MDNNASAPAAIMTEGIDRRRRQRHQRRQRRIPKHRRGYQPDDTGDHAGWEIHPQQNPQRRRHALAPAEFQPYRKIMANNGGEAGENSGVEPVDEAPVASD